MNNRLQSAIATILIHGVLFYALYQGLAISIARRAPDTMTLVKIATSPPPKAAPPQISQAAPIHYLAHPDAIDWPTASPELRNLAFLSIFKWIRENTVTEEEKRLARWRALLPQGSGPGRVTRLRPPNLATHTLYWPAQWSKGLLPIVAWGNGYWGMCDNSSLPYAAFLSDIASYGYFVVAVGNDDIDYPMAEGLELLQDGRPVRTQASALKAGVDWAIAENSRPGSPYYGKIDTSKISYMGQGCGAQQALTASSDPRATTAVMLNAAVKFRPNANDAHKPILAHFEGGREDSNVLDVGDVNFARAEAAKWPMYKAALNGMTHYGAYSGPDRHWSKGVIAWLDWQLKGNTAAARQLTGLGRGGWSRIDATGLALQLPPEGKEIRTQPIVIPPDTVSAVSITAAQAARAAAFRAFSMVPARQVQVNPEGGGFVLRDMVDDNPLYSFDKDERGKSNCTGTCSATFRPLAVTDRMEAIGDWTVIRREDGTDQWAYKGMPVYSFAKDPQPVMTPKGVGNFHRLPSIPPE